MDMCRRATHPVLADSRRIGEIAAPTDAELVVYCGHGPRAVMAAPRYGDRFTRITYLDGHFSQWRSARLREET